MLQRNQRTVDVYENAGAIMRLLKTVGTKAAVDVSCVLSAQDRDKLNSALQKIIEICSRAEENMFSDHPELSNEYLSVFYGAFGDEPRNETDARVMAKSRSVVDELFKRK